MAASNRSTDKPSRKMKVKEVCVIVEGDDPPGGVVVPNPPADGKWHLISNNGSVGWEPHE